MSEEKVLLEKTAEQLAQAKINLKSRSEKKAADLADDPERVESLANLFARVNLSQFDSTKWVDIESFETSKELDLAQLQFAKVTGAIYPLLIRPVYPTANSYAQEWFEMTLTEVQDEVARAKKVEAEDKKAGKEKNNTWDPIAKNGERINLGAMFSHRRHKCEEITNDTARKDIGNKKAQGAQSKYYLDEDFPRKWRMKSLKLALSRYTEP